MTDQHRPLATKVYSLSALVLVSALSTAMAPRPAAAEPAVTPIGGPARLFDGKSLGDSDTWLNHADREDPRQASRFTDKRSESVRWVTVRFCGGAWNYRADSFGSGT
jgi:hypothetical protein